MKLLKLLVVLFAVTGTQLLSAHEMWIEAKANGSIGAPQEVKVFFGEFSWGKPTPAAKWFSDIADCKLILTTPDGKTQELTKTKEEDCYKSTFTPNSKGIYKLGFVHVVKDVYKQMKLTYVSAALVNIDGAATGSTIAGEGFYQLKIDNEQMVKGHPTHFTVLEDGKPYQNQMVEVSNLDSATRNIETDKNALLTFPSDWHGGQLIQLAHPKKVEAGLHNGKEYTNEYTVFTFFTKPE